MPVIVSRYVSAESAERRGIRGYNRHRRRSLFWLKTTVDSPVLRDNLTLTLSKHDFGTCDKIKEFYNLIDC